MKVDLIFDSLLRECYGETPSLTTRERGRLNAACKELRGWDGKTDEDVAREITWRSDAYRRRYPSAALTPQALTGNWNQLGQTAARDDARRDYVWDEVRRAAAEETARLVEEARAYPAPPARLTADQREAAHAHVRGLRRSLAGGQ